MKQVSRKTPGKSGRRWGTVAFALIAVFALLAAACGSDGDGGDDDASEETTPTAETTTTTSAAPPPDDGGDGGTDTGTDSGTDSGTDGGEDSGSDDGGGSGTDVASDTSEDSGCDVEPYQDPRGQLFQAYQDQIDRCHPFQSLDSFCVAHDSPEPLADPDPDDSGIDEDSITFVHLRTELEDLASIGFATPVGDPTKMFETFTWYVNEVCGGIYGRMIDLRLVEVPATGSDVDAQRNAACIKSTEDFNGVFVLNSTGFQGSANLCLVEEHYAAFISTQSQVAEWVERGEDRLIVLSPTQEENLQFLTSALIEDGALDGKTIAVVAPNTPGQAESTEGGLVTPLRDGGFNVPVFDILDCAGGPTCTGGMAESVGNLIDENVEVLFMTLNVISAPQYVREMVNQGFEPGDITFYNSDYNSQAGNLVTSKIVQFGGPEAGNLYNGTLIVDDSDPAIILDPDYVEPPFNKMCHDTYVEYHENVPGNEDLADPPHYPVNADAATEYGMVGTVCTEMRIALRAVYDAGPNPTREQIYDALKNLGAIDFSNMTPNSIRPGKPQTPDAVHRYRFTYPCDEFAEYATDQNTCLVNVENDEWIPAPR